MSLESFRPYPSTEVKRANPEVGLLESTRLNRFDSQLQALPEDQTDRFASQMARRNISALDINVL